MPPDQAASPHLSPILLDALTGLVSQASAAIMAIGRADLATRLKPDQSPVTAADEAAEHIILEGLARIAPGIPVVSEEAAARGHKPDLADSLFLVDPLDGTREFIAGRPEFTVNVALVEGGRPVLGIIAAPALGLVWRAMAGQGAERFRLAPGAPPRDAAELTQLHTRRPCPGALVAVVSRSHLDAATEALLSRLPIGERVACGSSLKFCRIAEGGADIYPRLAPTSEWDIAAGCGLVEAAGGTVRTPQGQALRFGTSADSLIVPAFVAWGDPQASVWPSPR